MQGCARQPVMRICANTMENKSKKKVLLIALNVHREYSLALHYLKLYALEDKTVQKNISLSILEMEISDDLQQIFREISAHEPQIVAFSCNIWNIKKTLELVELCRFQLHAFVILGGQEVTHSSIEYLNHQGVDVIVDGEGEQTFTDLLKGYLTDNLVNLEGIPGIRFRKNGHIVSTGVRNPIRDLDLIPSPYLSGSITADNENHLGAMIELTRGCPHRCRFCFEASNFPRARYFSMDRIRSEMAHLLKQGIFRFHFLDPILAGANAHRLSELDALIGELSKEYDRLFIPVEIYAEYVTEKNHRLLSHFSVFDVGLQTINEGVQKNIGRRFNIAKFRQGYQLLKSLGREINIYLILGLPGDNYDSYIQSVRFVAKLKPTFFHINTLFLLNGIPMRDDVETFGIEFNKNAPYEVTANNTFPEKRLKIAKIFAQSSSRMFNLNRALFRSQKKMRLSS